MRKVLISPGYGAGWSTWNDDDVREHFLFDPDLIAAVEAGTPLGVRDDEATPLGAFLARVTAAVGRDYHCVLGARDLCVETVSGGFQVDEYDGYESIRLASEQEWL